MGDITSKGPPSSRPTPRFLELMRRHHQATPRTLDQRRQAADARLVGISFTSKRAVRRRLRQLDIAVVA